MCDYLERVHIYLLNYIFNTSPTLQILFHDQARENDGWSQKKRGKHIWKQGRRCRVIFVVRLIEVVVVVVAELILGLTIDELIHPLEYTNREA